MELQPYLIYWSIGATFNVFFLVAVFLTGHLAVPHYVPARWQVLPFAVKLLGFVILMDCSG